MDTYEEMELEVQKPVQEITEDETAMAVVSAGEIARVQGQIISAKKFPRDETTSYQKILTACKRESLAKTAMYSYPRGGTTVRGPSIRLAEQLARSWGNLDTGIRELSQVEGESVVEAYCLDLETNYRSSIIFSVKHVRKTKTKTNVLDDPRDIYEHVANLASRRKRSCILAVIPADITEGAIAACEETLIGGGGEPLIDRLRNMVVMFKELDETVTQEMLEKKIGYKIEEATKSDLTELGSIYNSIKDNMTKRLDWFEEKKGVKTDASKKTDAAFGSQP